MKHTLRNQKGFVVSTITFFVLIIMLSVSLSMSTVIFYRQRIATNSVKSTQSYYAGESGIEDALLRLNNNPQLSPITYNLTVGSAITAVNIPATVGGTRTILSTANNTGIIRKIETVYSLNGKGIAFHYGAQVGAGGLIMNNGSNVKGNVFSSGNITGAGVIDNNVIVATNGNKIDGPRVKGNVLAYACLNSIVDGNLIYVTGGTNTCSVAGTTATQGTSIPSQPLPISQVQIDQWKADATAGGTLGSVTVSDTQSLGPKKITGNLTLSNGATLNMTGTLYVVGDIILNNGSTIKLDTSYGSLSGVVISDGKINLSNNSSALGSSQAGSYMLMLSTNTGNDAININNNGAGGIFYTSAGGIKLNNNAQVKEITGYRIELQNNSTITYESGLANAFFSSGPGGGWKVTSWKEK